jgi:hypothetical protein
MSFFHFFTAGVPIAILLIVIVEQASRKKTFEYARGWTRAILLIQALISIVTVSSALLTGKEIIMDRLTGPYAFAFIVMLVNGTLVPLLVLNGRLARRIWVLFIVAVAVNGGRIFEMLVVMVSSFHRDGHISFSSYMSDLIVPGFLLGTVMIILELIIRKHNLTLGSSLLKKNVFTSLLIVLACTLVYLLGIWVRSIYGLDPPYSYFFVGLILEQTAILFVSLLIVHYAMILIERQKVFQI